MKKISNYGFFNFLKLKIFYTNIGLLKLFKKKKLVIKKVRD